MKKTDPLAGLEKVPWRQLGTSGGSRATNLPKILRKLAQIRDPDEWLKEYTELPNHAYLTHCYGPYVSEAAAHAVPFVVALLPLAPEYLRPPSLSGNPCLEVLLHELVSICNGIVHSRQERLEQAQLWGGILQVPSEDTIAREHQILQRARTAVRKELDRLLVYADHPGSEVRSAVYALAQSLPEERGRFEPLLRKKLEDEQDPVARSGLLLALDGKVTCQGIPSQVGRIPLVERQRLWKTESARGVRFVLAYSLVMQLRDEAPPECMVQLAQAMGQTPLLPSQQQHPDPSSVEKFLSAAAQQIRQQTLRLSHPNDAWELAREGYLPLRSSVAMEVLFEALTEGYFQERHDAIKLLLHALSGNQTPSLFWNEAQQPGARCEPLRPFPAEQISGLSAKVLAHLASSDWFWPWGSELLEAYGLPGTRDGLLLRLG